MAVGRIEVVLACALACALLVAPAATASADETPRDSARAEIIRLLSLDDEALIDTIQERAFEYFWHEVNPENGLIRDRSTPWSPSSIAAVGFGLSAIPIGVERGWISREEGYERTVTTVANAYLRPRCRAYLDGLTDAADDVLVMTSAAGLARIERGADLPVSLLLSGPAGGVLAAAAAAEAAGFGDVVTFDMGGTSTDVCLVQGGIPAPAGERSVGGFPIRMPSLDVHTIGAGGGSIAVVDAGGALQVGPRSAGAIQQAQAERQSVSRAAGRVTLISSVTAAPISVPVRSHTYFGR